MLVRLLDLKLVECSIQPVNCTYRVFVARISAFVHLRR